MTATQNNKKRCLCAALLLLEEFCILNLEFALNRSSVLDINVNRQLFIQVLLMI